MPFRIQPGCALPPARMLLPLFIGGFCGLMAWEFFARVVTPVFVGGPLEPWSLIVRLVQNISGNGNLEAGIVLGRLAAETLHYVTGITLYPLLYYIQSRGVLSFGTLGDGILWGIVTWVLALGVFAGMAGLPFMLGWIQLTWFSGIGHVAYAVVAVLVTEWLAQTRALHGLKQAEGR